MVADDDQDILDMLTTVLISNGFHVQTSFNGESIEKLVVAENPDLLLLDIRMSGRSGKDICHTLKQNQATQHLPIILISANPDIAQTAEECGADGFVRKPFNIRQLLDKLKQYVE